MTTDNDLTTLIMALDNLLESQFEKGATVVEVKTPALSIRFEYPPRRAAPQVVRAPDGDPLPDDPVMRDKELKRRHDSLTFASS